MECKKCGSNSVGWINDPCFDEETKESIDGYYKCVICNKIYFETYETEQTLARGKNGK